MVRFIPPMQLALLFDQPLDQLKNLNFPVIVEPKFDGIRAWIVIKKNSVSVYSRNGEIFEGFGEYLAKFKLIPGWILDVEIFKHSWNQTISLLRNKKYYEVDIYVFDILSFSWLKTRRTPPLRARKKVLTDYFKKISPPINLKELEYKLVYNYEDLLKELDLNFKKKYEGSLIKDLESSYQFGLRNSSWLKIKKTDYETVKCIGVVPGTGRNEGRLGALIVKSADGRKFKVGGGFSDKMREELWRNPPIGKCLDIKFSKSSQKEAKVIFPVFVRFRSDVRCNLRGEING